jgi:NTP pyrophosphatase (non-canonical NTP hydrolase)
MLDPRPITVAEFDKHVRETNQLDATASATFLLGLVGEVGSLVSALKKKRRDKDAFFGYRDAVVEELGDVLWYMSAVAQAGGTSLLESLASATGRNPRPYGLRFERVSLQAPRQRGISFEVLLLNLAAQVGELTNRFTAGTYRRKERALCDDLRSLVGPLVGAATAAEVTLAEAVIANVAKIDGRWPTKRRYPLPVDNDLHIDEQLPRRMRVLIYERRVGSSNFVFQKMGRVLLGDRLTDNHSPPDDYRFHDVFHLAHATILAWSPVTRALLKVKRKSQKDLDENQDGARAVLIEEGLTTWIFEIARRHHFFANTPKLGLDLLKNVKDFVSGYEAEKLPMWVWEQAILQGYAVFRGLREKRRGAVVADMRKRKIWLEAMTPEEIRLCGLGPSRYPAATRL